MTRRSWAEGLNFYTVSIGALLGATLVLLEESWRVRLVREIGAELDGRQDQPARRAWFKLLSEDAERSVAADGRSAGGRVGARGAAPRHPRRASCASE